MADLEVCIVIAARNAEATIAKAVASALAQDHVREVIVVDDASTDGTATAAGSADDGTGRLEILVEPRNIGPAGARNQALAHSASPFFCVLDADDYLLPGRMAKLLAIAPAEWDMIADDIVILPEEARLDFSIGRRDGPAPQRTLDLESFVLGNISRAGHPRGELGFLKPVVSRDFMRRHGLRYDDTMRLGEDYAFYVRALLHGARFRLVGACGYVAVERPDSLSSCHSADDLRRVWQFDHATLRACPQLTPAETLALKQHRSATWKKYTYAAALEAKARHGFAAGLARLARSPAALPYVLAETVRAKTSRLRSRFRPDAAPAPRSLRFLIGMADVQFADVRPRAPAED